MVTVMKLAIPVNSHHPPPRLLQGQPSDMANVSIVKI